MSKTINRLEDDLGVSLFERSNGGMKLNENGILAQNTFSVVMMLINGMKETFTNNNETKLNQVNILTTTSSSCTDMISSFASKHPEIYVMSKEYQADEFRLTDLQGRIDFLISSEEFPEHEELNKIVLFNHVPVVLVRDDNPLAKKVSVTLREAVQYPLISSPRGTNWANFVISLLDSHSLKIMPVLECNYPIRKQAVAAGLGITITSKMGVEISPPPANVITLQLEDEYPEITMNLYWSKKRKLNSAAKAFTEYALAYYNDIRSN